MRLALFGGTFDPIHSAHLMVAQEAADKFGLERIWFIPAAHPPHKEDLTGAGYEDRYEMVRLACAADSRFVASRIEEGAGKSYSIDTIEKLWSPHQTIYFIIGADAFAEIRTWRRWQDVIQLVTFIVVTRPGHDYRQPEGVRVESLDTVALPVSSSEIRQQLAAGKLPSELPDPVAEYIAARGLYQWPANSR